MEIRKVFRSNKRFCVPLPTSLARELGWQHGVYVVLTMERAGELTIRRVNVDQPDVAVRKRISPRRN